MWSFADFDELFRVVQLKLHLRLKVYICFLKEFILKIKRNPSKKQHLKYFNFRSKIHWTTLLDADSFKSTLAGFLGFLKFRLPCGFRFKNCAHSNLNGLNTADETVDRKRRIWWRGILDQSGERATLDTAEMMIRLKKEK